MKSIEHELKIWPQYFRAVQDGIKTFEVRVNDRGFQKGDTVKLMEYDPETKEYTDDWYRYYIGYVLPIDDKRVVFSLIKISDWPTDSQSVKQKE